MVLKKKTRTQHVCTTWPGSGVGDLLFLIATSRRCLLFSLKNPYKPLIRIHHLLFFLVVVYWSTSWSHPQSLRFSFPGSSPFSPALFLVILTFIYMIFPTLGISLPLPYFQSSFPPPHHNPSSRTVESTGNKMWVTNVSHMCNFKCYRSHVKKVKRNRWN